MQEDKFNIIVFLVVTCFIILLLAGLIITLVYFYQKKQLSHLRNLETLKLNHEKSIMSAQLEIQEETFQHISWEIHDNINHSLTLAKLRLNTLDWNKKEIIKSQVNSSIELISQSIANLSDISKSLNSDVISSYGIITAIKNEIHRIGEIGLFNIKMNINGTPVYMDIQRELIIFRIIQEAFNNVIKHAKATNTVLTLDYNPTELHIIVRDNGIGFMLPNTTHSDQIGKAGLKNMEKRTKMIGGIMQLESLINKGTALSFKFPY